MDKYGVVRPDITPRDDQDHDAEDESQALQDHTTKTAADLAEATLTEKAQKKDE